MATTWRPGQGTAGYDPYGISKAGATAATGQGGSPASRATPTYDPYDPNGFGWRGARNGVSKSPAPTGTGAAPPLPGGQSFRGDPPAAAPTPAMGTESGAGILENWFNQRASGTDPAFEYTQRRGMDAIDRRMAAGGSFNSGARGEQLSDFAANSGAQRMGQLDSLAGGASGEHQGRLNSMFQQMLGMAGGQAGLAGAYDISAANNMSASDRAILEMMINKAGVDGKADQGFLNNLFSIASLGAGAKK